MGKLATVLFTTVVTATLTSLFWIGAYSIASPEDAPPPAAAAAAAAADPSRPPAVVPAKGPARSGDIVMSPSGMAIPVTGVRADQLIDTYSQSRGGGRPHDAI